MITKNKYDVIIIGAGIGGLVCGCYLARAGLSVLIIEQHRKTGGYCSSFTRSRYSFDVGVHYFGGVKKGILCKIIEELDLKDKIKFKQFDPTDKIFLPNKFVYLRSDHRETIEEFKKNFPNEKANITTFFNFVLQKSFFKIYEKIFNLSVEQVLNSFFKDLQIKSIFNALLRNIGLTASHASALNFIILLREYLLDPGYYPVGGMQRFPDVLVKDLKQHGGDFSLSTKVTSILIKQNKAEGVIVEDSKQIIKSDFVISNADASLTFTKLSKIKTRESNLVKKLETSPSAFAVYLGLSANVRRIIKDTCTYWPFISYSLKKSPIISKKDLKNNTLPISIITFPSAHDPVQDRVDDIGTVSIFAITNYESKKFWQRNKNIFSDALIKQAENFIPGINKFIIVKEIATPQTFFEYTLNKKGSLYGFASTIKQISASNMPPKSSVDKLFSVGHWCTVGSGQGGIPKVSFCGRRVSSIILREMGIPWKYGEYLL